jgi:lysophospholipase L1-like esterase
MTRYSDILRGYFASATAKRAIDYLDLTPALQQAARAHGTNALLYYQTNVHLTAAGHRVIAEAIAAHLNARKR